MVALGLKKYIEPALAFLISQASLGRTTGNASLFIYCIKDLWSI